MPRISNTDDGSPARRLFAVGHRPALLTPAEKAIAHAAGQACERIPVWASDEWIAEYERGQDDVGCYHMPKLRRVQ